MKTIYKYLLLVALALIAVLPSCAQRKEIQAARDQVKSGKNLDAAESSMRRLLADSANHDNLKIWAVLYDAVSKQYDQGNESLYLKQKYDTAKFFNNALRLFKVAIEMDSVDARPDSKGRVRPQFRDHHADHLNPLRPNLYNGGAYFFRKRDFKQAYEYFNTYIDCTRQPLFRKMKYAESDKYLPQAAYWAMYSAYNLKDTKATLHHAYWAQKDTAHTQYILQFLATTYMMEKDTARYVNTLEEGFLKYPEFPYFFPHLVDYYTSVGNLADAERTINKAIEINDSNEVFLFARTTLLLNTGRYDECADLCNRLIAINDSLPGAWLNAGLARFNQAVELDKDIHQERRNKQKIMDYYDRARAYLERYRQLRPDDKDHWALPLYTIYLNLNMGKEFDEIDRLLK